MGITDAVYSQSVGYWKKFAFFGRGDAGAFWSLGAPFG